MEHKESSAPIVSIVIPVYNAQTFLQETLNTVSVQTFTQWETILVDDGSTDESPKICEEAAKTDPRFRVIHKANEGVSTARNTGIEAAQGKYLMFVDADDLITPNCLEQFVEAAETYGTDLVLSGFERFWEDWSTVYATPIYSVALIRDVRKFLMLYTESKTNMYGVSVWAKLFRTELIHKYHLRFDPEISYEEDCAFITDCLKYFRTFAVLGESHYRYRQQQESLSKGYRKDTFRFLVNGYDKRCALLKANGMDEYLPKLKNIFFTVVKNTCKKILSADLPKEEKIEEYRKLMEFPEVQEAVTFERKSKSGLTNRICAAIRARDPKRLNRVMQSWKVMDQAVSFKNTAITTLKEKIGKGNR